jgi:hypothetical protein
MTSACQLRSRTVTGTSACAGYHHHQSHRERVQPRLGRAVDRRARRRDEPERGGDVDDGGLGLAHQLWNEQSREHDGRFEVDLDLARPGLEILEPSRQIDVPLNAGVVDQDVQVPEALAGPRYQRSAFVPITVLPESFIEYLVVLP